MRWMHQGVNAPSAWYKLGVRGQQPERRGAVSWTHQAVETPPTCYQLGMRRRSPPEWGGAVSEALQSYHRAPPFQG